MSCILAEINLVWDEQRVMDEEANDGARAGERRTASTTNPMSIHNVLCDAPVSPLNTQSTAAIQCLAEDRGENCTMAEAGDESGRREESEKEQRVGDSGPHAMEVDEEDDADIAVYPTGMCKKPTGVVAQPRFGESDEETVDGDAPQDGAGGKEGELANAKNSRKRKKTQSSKKDSHKSRKGGHLSKGRREKDAQVADQAMRGTGEAGEEADNAAVYCFCRKSAVGFMIFCNKCEEWYHGECVNISSAEGDAIEEYICGMCTAMKGITFTCPECPQCGVTFPSEGKRLRHLPTYALHDSFPQHLRYIFG